jgi:hypothetical protein
MSPLSFIRWFDIIFLPIGVGATTSQHILPFDIASPLCTDASCNIATAHEVLPPTSHPWSCKLSCAPNVTTSSSSSALRLSIAVFVISNCSSIITLAACSMPPIDNTGLDSTQQRQSTSKDEAEISANERRGPHPKTLHSRSKICRQLLR